MSRGFVGCFDFLYLPYDLTKQLHKGYGNLASKALFQQSKALLTRSLKMLTSAKLFSRLRELCPPCICPAVPGCY